MIILTRTDSNNQDFQELVKALDKVLKITDGEEHSFFSQFNKIDTIPYVVVAYQDSQPVGCGAIKPYNENTMEVKRMFVPSEFRGKGIATFILIELEKWCRELNVEKCILETGIKLSEAVNLYYKNNYTVIPNYGQYENVESSICFEKILI